MSADLEQARRLVADAQHVVALTGAGISAESGVPTFRSGAGALWKSHRPEELATPQAFARDPLLVWEWYAWRRGLIAECEPNAGHHALAAFALRRGQQMLVTQNVDGLHTRAARAEAGDADPAAALPLELHGAIGRDRCPSCRRAFEGRVDVDVTSIDTLPACPECGDVLRPDVVWFGESLDSAVLSRAFELGRQADLCLVIGTSAVVHPAASVPLSTLQTGGSIIEVNPEETPLTSRATVALRGPSGEILPALFDA